MHKIPISRAVRGAITVEENTAENINSAILELLQTILKVNQITEDDIVSVIFTLTPDLNAEFPAKAARIYLGWDDTPMICASEVPVPDSIKKCIRVMITFNTLKTKEEIKHVYLGKAQELRPDLVQ
ncbi:MAG: chorismate mutase [Candidatus Melainabacteria bacterium GWF2_37_15]|nr:MAG: chorismate mutase [Candidatus Melainabacteria bacterium GWF2_37_15]